MTYLKQPAVPNFPLSTKEWDFRYHDQFLNVLRLYLVRSNNSSSSLLGTNGGQYLGFPYGSFCDTTDQIAANTTTAYPVTLNTTNSAQTVSIVSSSRITFAVSGIYNIQFSLQLVNTTNSSQDIDVWFRKNGTDIANSNSRFGLAPRKGIGDPYHTVGSLNFIESVVGGDYIQLLWKTSHVDAYMEHYSAPSSPTRPAIPSAIVTATFVSTE